MSKKLFKTVLWIVLCVFVFVVSFGGSALVKLSSIFGLSVSNAGFALQGNAAENPLKDEELTRNLINIDYITHDGRIETRPIMMYWPANASGDLPLIYIPHYAAEENTADFASYIRNGWAVASPYEFKSEYNGLLVTDDLVFNNAALYTLRNMDGIDHQRIAIVGGSAGGYMTMMLTQLQMGTTAALANSPINNIYFNFHVHFAQCNEINRNSGIFEFPIPYLGLTGKSFSPIYNVFESEEDPRWEAVSPIGMARAISSPVVINHFTADMLVPIDQLSKTYSYDENDGTLPEGFNACLGDDYPGILSKSLEELADPDEMTITKYESENKRFDMDIPFSDRLLTINIFDDGQVSAKNSHMSNETASIYNIMPYLNEMMVKTLKATEKLIPEKVMLLLERYEGNSLALPAHTNVDDSVYGSLAIYKKEIIDELSVYKDNHSLDEMETIILQAIDDLSENESERSLHTQTWNEIKSKLS